MSILSSLLNKITGYKVYIYGGIIIVVLSLFAYNWYLRVEVKSLMVDKKILVDANKTNNKTILKLKEEVKSINSLCEKRLKSKEKTIKKLKEVDEIDSQYLGKNDNNSIINRLNRMFNNN